MTDTIQRQLSQCTAPCFPVDCPDCPFGPMDMGLEEIQRKWLGGVQDD
jgi:hypothetical protein